MVALKLNSKRVRSLCRTIWKKNERFMLHSKQKKRVGSRKHY
jgi:hypothetical protein